MAYPSELSFTDSLKADQRRHFYERNKQIAIVMIVVVFLAPFIGIFVRGLSGAVWGVILSVLGYYLAPFTVLKLRQ